MLSWTASDRARSLALSSCLLLGCNELLGFGAFDIGDASSRDGGRDAGTFDASRFDGGPRDAGCLRDWFRDEDMDGFGDPERSMSSCTQPADHVDNGDDCDDDDEDRRPGEDETCDGIDQDCDGALDEGLFGPIGPLVPAVEGLGIGFNQGEVDVVTTLGGHTVAYRRYGTDAIYATFFDLAGVAVDTAQFVGGRVTAGEPARELAMTRVTIAGLDSIVIAWREDTAIYYRQYTADGAGGSSLTAFELDAADAVRNLEVRQQGTRLLLSWRDDESALHIISIDNPGAAATTEMVLTTTNDGGGGLVAEWQVGATLATDPPQAILTRIPPPTFIVPDGGRLPDGGLDAFDDGGLPAGYGVTFAPVELTALRGTSTLTLGTPRPWEHLAACDAEFPICLGSLTVSGSEIAPGEPGLLVTETLLQGNLGFTEFSTEVCVRRSLADADGTITAEPTCTELPGLTFALTPYILIPRGTVATALIETGTTRVFGIMELPLTDEADGNPTLTPLPGFESILLTPQASVRGGHGAVLGDTEARADTDVVLQRLGCSRP